MKRLLPATRDRIQEFVATTLSMKVGHLGRVTDGIFFDDTVRIHTVHVGGLRRGSSRFVVEVLVEFDNRYGAEIDVAEAATWIDLVPQLTAFVDQCVRWRAELPMPAPPPEPPSTLDRLLGPDRFNFEESKLETTT